MLFLNSIYTTKKKFQKVIQNLKAYLYGGEQPYDLLPKIHSFNPFSCGQSTVHMDVHQQIKKSDYKHDQNNKMVAAGPETVAATDQHGNKEVKFHGIWGKTTGTREEDRIRSTDSYPIAMREQRSRLVAQKLKELEMEMVGNTNNNQDHTLDIKEVLYYYSCLTCPSYLDMVDRFVTQMFLELSSPIAGDCSLNSINLKL